VNEQELRDLVTAVKLGRVSRRAPVRRMVALGLTAPSASQLLAHAGVAQTRTQSHYKRGRSIADRFFQRRNLRRSIFLV
jgi:peptide/nickel transport system substrate-binding protein